MDTEELHALLERMTAASAALAWLSDQAEGLADSSADRVQMIKLLGLARGYVVEYAAHRARGKSPEAALASTVKGELDVSQHMDSYRKSLN